MTSARLRPVHLVVVLALVIAAFVVGMITGAARISPLQVGAVLLDRLPYVSLDTGLLPVQESLLIELRLPRVLTGALVGGLLAVAGAGYQGVFRNPLADPYLLGAAAGAGLGATVVIGFFGGTAALVPVAAFVGALGGVTLAYLLGTAAGRRGTANLVLAGVAVSSFLAAAQTYVQQARVDELRRIYSWIMGQLTADWDQLAMVAPYALAGVVVLLLHARLLDVLSVGDDEASALGLHPVRVRLAVLAAASLATAAAVAVSGLIGFVGIVVPHIVRRLAGGGNRIVIPLSMLAGAAFMMLTDVAARTLVSPAELPIGVVTAFIGAPIFVLVLRASRVVTP